MTDHEPTPRTFSLPDVGEGLTEAEIVAWHVAAGDAVAVNQIIVEIETAKSIVELPSPFAGTVTRLLAEIGDTVPVGQAIIEVGGAAADDAQTDGTTAERAEQAEETEQPKLLVGYGVTDSGQARRRRRPEAERSSAVRASDPRPSTADRPSKPRAKPPVRRLAKQLGVDLSALEPTGPGETVSRDDVRRATAPATATVTPPSPDDVTRIPIKGVRKATAQAVVASAFSAPHVTEFVTVDVTRAMELREELQRRPEFAQLKLSPLALVARAYLKAFARTPMAAAHWDEEAQQIVVPSTVNLGIAAATPRGLLVPNIKGAERLGLLELAQAIAQLAETARAGKTPPADLADGTTTITNIGVFGIDTGTPILNPGETAILAVGAVKRMPWVVETEHGERIEPRSVMQLALSFDHRVLDGAEGSQLLADTAELLHQPALAML